MDGSPGGGGLTMVLTLSTLEGPDGRSGFRRVLRETTDLDVDPVEINCEAALL